MKIIINHPRAAEVIIADVPPGSCFLLDRDLYLKTAIGHAHWNRVPEGYVLCILLRSGVAENVDLNTYVTPADAELTATPRVSEVPLDVTGTSS